MNETILQFGAGNFLRAFADLFVEHANRTAIPVGRIVVVQSTDSGRGNLLNARSCRY
jgi:mannitol-1-phosphate/altronate dehydrogenase